MDRKSFLAQVGFGAAALLVPSCMAGLAGCSKSDNITPPSNVDFTLDVSSGSLSSNGGFIVKDGVIVARTNTGTFIAVSAACTHQGTTVNYGSSTNSFICPNHGARFDASGLVIQGPAVTSLRAYKTVLTGNSLRVTS
jgi:cytochrome b6-f complex iron-sulfur subunit